MSCPICHKLAIERYKPFCSKRCADIDLGQWFNEKYSAIAVENDIDQEADSENEAKDISLFKNSSEIE